MDLLADLASSTWVGQWGREGTLVGVRDDPMPQPGRTRRPLDLWVLHVDLTGADWDVESAAGVLSAPERRRAMRGVPSVHRRRVLLRAALRGLLGSILEMHPAAVPLTRPPGKPGLESSAGRPDLDMSCSASGHVGLVSVVQGGCVGVDVQRIGDEDLQTAVAEGWLSAAERAALAKLPLSQHPHALTRAWAQKEAVLKGQGTGLRADPARTVTPVADRGRVGQWWISPVPVAQGYVASLAIAPASPGRVRSDRRRPSTMSAMRGRT